VRIKLIRKLSNVLNGLDLRPHNVGDVIEIGDAHAHMLVAEGWAERLAAPLDRATADHHTRGNVRTTPKRLKRLAVEAARRRGKKR
jgi:hypothetical protein